MMIRKLSMHGLHGILHPTGRQKSQKQKQTNEQKTTNIVDNVCWKKSNRQVLSHNV